MSGAAPRSLPPNGIGVGLATQGMISPATPFVNPDDTLQPVSFRFLWALLQTVSKLEGQVATLQQRLTAAGL